MKERLNLFGQIFSILSLFPCGIQVGIAMSCTILSINLLTIPYLIAGAAWLLFVLTSIGCHHFSRRIKE